MQKVQYQAEMLALNTQGGFIKFPKAQAKVKKPLVEFSDC